jgi:hypothetical protein
LRLPVIATAHDPKGNWLGADRTRVEEWGSVKMDDATGLPRFVHDNRQDFLPITVAHYGLEHYSLWAVQGNADDLAKAVKAARLVRGQPGKQRRVAGPVRLRVPARA